MKRADFKLNSNNQYPLSVPDEEISAHISSEFDLLAQREPKEQIELLRRFALIAGIKRALSLG